MLRSHNKVGICDRFLVNLSKWNGDASFHESIVENCVLTAFEKKRQLKLPRAEVTPRKSLDLLLLDCFVCWGRRDGEVEGRWEIHPGGMVRLSILLLLIEILEGHSRVNLVALRYTEMVTTY